MVKIMCMFLCYWLYENRKQSRILYMPCYIPEVTTILVGV